ncbi:MAG: hypothetical protein ISR85_02600 [Kiritimatiellales bacterium]|nr:hypothetical protein [Kiritimatiellota bacterium]MBL7011802.1 hypothetical protein [Kiritimatiellales bacterium]
MDTRKYHRKKFITLAAAVALASIVFGMGKAPTDATACAVKEAAACSTAEAACKLDAAKTGAGCGGGTCPLPK